MKKSLLIMLLITSVISQSRAQFKMYGMTFAGGAYDSGVIFTITPNGSFNKVVDLNHTYADLPYGSLLLASDNNFYGMSWGGGYHDSCTMFRCTPTGNVSTLINMDSTWGGGSGAHGSLIQATDGNLYGMVYEAGNSNLGLIFRYVIATGKYTVLHNFTDSSGGNPYGDLLQANDGNLYGMTSIGGLAGNGTIFKCSLAGTFSVIFNFTHDSGISPHGSLIQAADGFLYGMTSSGGDSSGGTIFKCSLNGNFAVIHSFTGIDTGRLYGYNPMGSLIQGSDGNLYGLTHSGGAYGFGVLFQCTTSGTFKKLVDFDSTNGSYPQGSLSQASDGLLYGMTTYGGSDNLGTIFKCTTAGSLTTLLNFDGTNGATPMYGRVIEASAELGINGLLNQSSALTFYPNPNNGNFTVLLKGISPKNQITIFNILGEQVYQSSLNATSNQIEMSSKADGPYLYRVISETGELVGQGEFVIQK